MSKRTEARKLWQPKRPEMKEQCISCPFREGNDAEFLKMLERLAESAPPGTDIDINPERARFMLRIDADLTGDFICHCSAYDEDMSLRECSEHKQCPGASKFFKDGGMS